MRRVADTQGLWMTLRCLRCCAWGLKWRRCTAMIPTTTTTLTFPSASACAARCDRTLHEAKTRRCFLYPQPTPPLPPQPTNQPTNQTNNQTTNQREPYTIICFCTVHLPLPPPSSPPLLPASQPYLRPFYSAAPRPNRTSKRCGCGCWCREKGENRGARGG